MNYLCILINVNLISSWAKNQNFSSVYVFVEIVEREELIDEPCNFLFAGWLMVNLASDSVGTLFESGRICWLLDAVLLGCTSWLMIVSLFLLQVSRLLFRLTWMILPFFPYYPEFVFFFFLIFLRHYFCDKKKLFEIILNFNVILWVYE